MAAPIAEAVRRPVSSSCRSRAGLSLFAASGLGELFDAVEIVSDKTAATYRRIFTHHGDGPQRSMMVGNSLKSDVVPAIEAGGWGVHVPHALTWVLEHVEPPVEAPRYRQIGSLAELADLIEAIG